MKALINTQGKANIKIGTIYFLNTCQSKLNPASNTKIGKKIYKSPCGLMKQIVLIEFLTNPSSRLKAPKPVIIPKKNKVGVYDNP